MAFDWAKEGNCVAFPKVVASPAGGIYIVNQCRTCGGVFFKQNFLQGIAVPLLNFCDDCKHTFNYSESA